MLFSRWDVGDNNGDGIEERDGQEETWNSPWVLPGERQRWPVGDSALRRAHRQQHLRPGLCHHLVRQRQPLGVAGGLRVLVGRLELHAARRRRLPRSTSRRAPTRRPTRTSSTSAATPQPRRAHADQGHRARQPLERLPVQRHMARPPASSCCRTRAPASASTRNEWAACGTVDALERRGPLLLDRPHRVQQHVRARVRTASPNPPRSAPTSPRTPPPSSAAT